MKSPTRTSSSISGCAHFHSWARSTWIHRLTVRVRVRVECHVRVELHVRVRVRGSVSLRASVRLRASSG